MYYVMPTTPDGRPLPPSPFFETEAEAFQWALASLPYGFPYNIKRRR